MGQNSKISIFFARKAKQASAEGRSPSQELEVGPRSGLYLLVLVKTKFMLKPLEAMNAAMAQTDIQTNTTTDIATYRLNPPRGQISENLDQFCCNFLCF